MIKPDSTVSIKFHITKGDIVAVITQMLCYCPDARILTKKNIDEQVRKILHKDGMTGILRRVDDPVK